MEEIPSNPFFSCFYSYCANKFLLYVAICLCYINFSGHVKWLSANVSSFQCIHIKLVIKVRQTFFRFLKKKMSNARSILPQTFWNASELWAVWNIPPLELFLCITSVAIHWTALRNTGLSQLQEAFHGSFLLVKFWIRYVLQSNFECVQNRFLWKE